MTTRGEELRQEAVELRASARESFERCDTDGFLSQWADGINARLAEAKADIADAGGTALFARWILLNAAGEELDARRVETRYGVKWRIDSTDEWLTWGSERAAKRRGYEVREVVERADAGAAISAQGRGLSGAASATIRIYRKGAASSEGWRCIGITQDNRQAAREERARAREEVT